jgi:hypothetical protein
LSEAYRPQEFAHDAYRLYERFRPDIPEGKKGWGAKGDLDLGRIGRWAKVCRVAHKPCSAASLRPAWQNLMRSDPEVNKPRP